VPGDIFWREKFEVVMGREQKIGIFHFSAAPASEAWMVLGGLSLQPWAA